MAGKAVFLSMSSHIYRLKMIGLIKFFDRLDHGHCYAGSPFRNDVRNQRKGYCARAESAEVSARKRIQIPSSPERSSGQAGHRTSEVQGMHFC